MPSPLTIGALAKAAGVNIETIRYYQRLGLVKQPHKPRSGYRVYPPDTVQRLQFIKRAQQLGFSLKEIDELLQLGKGQCRNVQKRAEQKSAQIQQQIQDLQALQKTLQQLIKRCVSGNRDAPCPIVETLTGTST